jgi:hypothetical protein
MTVAVLTPWPTAAAPRPTGDSVASMAAGGMEPLEDVVAMAEPTVGAGYARGLLEFAASKGASRAALFDRSGIQPATLQDQDARIPFRKYVALMQAAKALTGDSALALHYGEAVDIAEVSIIGLIGQASETMTEAFAQLNRYVRLIVETDNEGAGDRFRIVVAGAGSGCSTTARTPATSPSSPNPPSPSWSAGRAGSTRRRS